MGPVRQEDNEVIITSHDGRSVIRVLLKGATILSWKVDNKELLWLSESAVYETDKGIRGGIPLVFPLFGPVTQSYVASGEKLPQHGFGRNCTYEFLGLVSESPVTAQFGLSPENLEDKYKSVWPFDFTLLFTVTIHDNVLKTDIELSNPISNGTSKNTKSWDFNWLFHNYFAVHSGIKNVSVRGLTGLDYFDKVTKVDAHQEESEVTVSATIDRVYRNTDPSKPVVVCEGGKPTIEVVRENIDDVVVWNPWENDMSDFAPKTGYNDMICVEAGVVAKLITLKPGENWVASQTIKANL